MGLRIPLVRKRTAVTVPRQLPVDKIDEWFGIAYGYELQGRGFDQIDKRRWVRSTKAPIREGIQINETQGSFVPGWFLSLDPIPHVTGSGQIKRHDSASTARPDLVVDPRDEPDRFDVNTLVVSRFQTAADAKAAIKASTKTAVPHALRWFDRIDDVASLVAVYEEARSRPVTRFGFDDYMQHRLSYAFVLRLAGYEVLAMEEFELWTQGAGRDIPQTARDQLHARLRATRPVN